MDIDLLLSTFSHRNLFIYAVDHSADDATIKKAYRKLSRKYHPDKSKEPEAEARFVEIARGLCLS